MVTAQEQLQRIKEAQQRLRQISRITPAQRRKLTRTGLIKERQRRSQIAQKQQQLSTAKKRVKEFQERQRKVKIQREKQQGAVKTLIKEIQKNLKTKPSFISGAGISKAKKAFKLAGLDPKKAEEIFTKTITSNPVYSFSKFQSGRAKLAQKDIDKILSKNKTIQDLLKPPEILGIMSVDPNILLKKNKIIQGLLKPSEIKGIMSVDPNILSQTSKRIPSQIGEPFIPTVEVAPTIEQQLVRTIRESTPKLRLLGKSDIAKGIRTAIGIGMGTEKFAREKAKGAVFNIRDIEGRRIFTKEQASGLTDLTAEVIESYFLGKGAGKVATLSKGAVAKILPQALQKSKRFKRIVNVLDTAVISGLSINEAKKLRKTYNELGEDAALLQLIGLASFGFGFAKTGAKPSAQTQKEFNEFTNLLKKTIPKGKRGQTSLQKVLSKGRFEKLKELDKTRAERIDIVKAKIEKKLIKAKNRKEQLIILDNLAKDIKTPEAKANFRIFVEELINKRILKVPEIEVVPGVKVKELIPVKERIEVIVPKTKPLRKIFPTTKVTKISQINLEKIKKQQQKQQRRIAFSKQSLGQRYAVGQIRAQKLKTATVHKAAQRQKILQKQAPKFRVPTLLKAPATSKITKIPRIIVPPPFPFAKVKSKRKLVSPIKPTSKKGYYVLGKPLKKRKFVRLNKVPLKQSEAKDLGAWLIDHSLGRTFKLKQSNRPAQKPRLKVPKSYFTKHRKKFRNFKIIKGKKVFTPYQWIEKRGTPLLDTRAERKKITLLKKLSQLQKKSLIKRKKK